MIPDRPNTVLDEEAKNGSLPATGGQEPSADAENQGNSEGKLGGYAEKNAIAEYSEKEAVSGEEPLTEDRLFPETSADSQGAESDETISDETSAAGAEMSVPPESADDENRIADEALITEAGDETAKFESDENITEDSAETAFENTADKETDAAESTIDNTGAETKEISSDEVSGEFLDEETGEDTSPAKKSGDGEKSAAYFDAANALAACARAGKRAFLSAAHIAEIAAKYIFKAAKYLFAFTLKFLGKFFEVLKKFGSPAAGIIGKVLKISAVQIVLGILTAVVTAGIFLYYIYYGSLSFGRAFLWLAVGCVCAALTEDIHITGHMIAGYIAGFRFHALYLHFFNIERAADERTNITVSFPPRFFSRYDCFLPDLPSPVRAQILYFASGIAANCIVAIACSVVSLFVSSAFWTGFLSILAALCVVRAFFAMRVQFVRGIPSDAMMLRILCDSETQADNSEKYYLLYLFATQMRAGLRPSEMKTNPAVLTRESVGEYLKNRRRSNKFSKGAADKSNTFSLNDSFLTFMFRLPRLPFFRTKEYTVRRRLSEMKIDLDGKAAAESNAVLSMAAEKSAEESVFAEPETTAQDDSSPDLQEQLSPTETVDTESEQVDTVKPAEIAADSEEKTELNSPISHIDAALTMIAYYIAIDSGLESDTARAVMFLAANVDRMSEYIREKIWCELCFYHSLSGNVFAAEYYWNLAKIEKRLLSSGKDVQILRVSAYYEQRIRDRGASAALLCAEALKILKKRPPVSFAAMEQEFLKNLFDE